MIKKLFLAFLLLATPSVASAFHLVNVDETRGMVVVTLEHDSSSAEVSTDNLTWGGETVTDIIKGTYFYRICAAPGPSDDTPDDGGDVFVWLKINNEERVDMLGSEDSTTHYNGLNLVDSTTAECATPNMYVKRAGEHYTHYWLISDTVTVDYDESDSDGVFTIILYFVR